MVFWIVCREPGEAYAGTRYGPYESEALAEREINRLKACFLGSSSRRFRVVCDFS